MIHLFLIKDHLGKNFVFHSNLSIRQKVVKKFTKILPRNFSKVRKIFIFSPKTFISCCLSIFFFSFFCFFIWNSFHEHSRFTGQQGKGDAISLTPLCNFYLLHRNLDISRAITAESSPLHIAGSRTRTRNQYIKVGNNIIHKNLQ